MVKTLLKAFGMIILVLLAAGFVFVAMLSFPATNGSPSFLSQYKSPTPRNEPMPGTPADNAYPAPSVDSTASSITVENIPYPPPGEHTPAPTVTPWVTLEMVPPPFWPTDIPWPPPTSTPAAPTELVQAPDFPIPNFLILSKSTPDETLGKIFYVYQQSQNSPILFQKTLIDSAGYRKSQPEFSLDIGLKSSFPGPELMSLHTSFDGAYMALEEVYGESTSVLFMNLKTQEFLKTPETSNYKEFYTWMPGTLKAIVRINDIDSWGASRIDLVTGERVDFEPPKLDGAMPAVYTFAYSFDGSQLADGVTYPPTYNVRDYPLLEVGLWDKELKSRNILCKVEGGSFFLPNSLKWSPDGNSLLWISAHDSQDAKSSNQEIWLWLAHPETGVCSKIKFLGDNKDYVPGLYNAVWSPDSQTIAYTISTSTDQDKTYYVALYNPLNQQEKILTNSQNQPITHVSFSPAGNLIVFNVNQNDYGVIWAISLDGKESFPIAGPTLVNAPFAWLK